MLINIWLYSTLFLIGIAVGSFLNAFEYRLFKRIDFIKARSFCPKCKHTLGFLDLIPILSFALIGGKCRYCGTKVSWQYPIIEFLSGMLFLASGCYVSNRMHVEGISDIAIMILISIFIGLMLSLFLFFALYDVKHKIVPNKVIIPAIVFTLFLNIILAVAVHLKLNCVFLDVFGDFNLLWNTLSGLFGGIFIAIVIILTKGKGMGGGDLKLMVLMGFVLGWQRLIIAFYIAVFTGSFIGIIWGIYKKKIKGLKIPFAVFLALGTILAFLYGDVILSWYLEMVSVI